MKNMVICSICVIVSLLLIPLWTVTATPQVPSTASKKSLQAKSNSYTERYESFKIKLNNTQEIKEISATEYIIGVVAAEMPALYEEEAIKAQAVAAYTFACYKRDSSNQKYDLTADYKLDQAYLSVEELRERWGESFDAHYEKIKKAVEEVKGKRLCYKDKTALTVYHAISSGKTNKCSDVWTKDIPYLTSVESIGDKLSKDYISTVSFTKAELGEKLGVLGEGFSEINKTDSALIKSISFGGKTFSGFDIQRLLSLRSAAFDVVQSGDSFTFTVYGYGHGVGMSQVGANYMAKQGSSYKEILYWYYPKTQLIG